jgi:hypothetical protein
VSDTCFYCKQDIPGKHADGCAQANLRSIVCVKPDGTQMIKQWRNSYNHHLVPDYPVEAFREFVPLGKWQL